MYILLIVGYVGHVHQQRGHITFCRRRLLAFETGVVLEGMRLQLIRFVVLIFVENGSNGVQSPTTIKLGIEAVKDGIPFNILLSQVANEVFLLLSELALHNDGRVWT